MQPPSIVSGVSFRKKLREGQLRALSHRNVLSGTGHNVKLPTGYGKTLTACGVYSIRQKNLHTTRMLYLVPSRTQLDQFILGGPLDLADAGVVGERKILDIGFFPNSEVIKRHRTNAHQVFAATIQYAATGDGLKLCNELMEQGQWMIAVDEYHHYGVDKAWGKKVREMNANFVLAMSATPYRPKDDSAFGKPDVTVTYREAVKEGAVKPLRGHAYNYKIDAVDEDGNVTTYTTDELVREAGGDTPEAIEKFRIQRKMRWSPKYVSPLISIPITRMESERITTGKTLQALVSAMCVSHGELVCSQIKGMFPHLVIDWVGTGPNGRSDKVNAEILQRFCPPKPIDGSLRPKPEIDVLVHVGMAGEGLDVVNVSEVMLLRTASFNNSIYQIIGRGSRYLPGVTCHVSFDGSTAFAVGEKFNGDIIKGMGEALEYAMDYAPVDEDAEEEKPENGNEFPPELPNEPVISIQDMELLNIDSGTEGVRMMAKLRRASNTAKSDPVDYEALEHDPNDPGWQIIIKNFQMMQANMAAEYNEKSVIASGKIQSTTRLVMRLVSPEAVAVRSKRPV